MKNVVMQGKTINPSNTTTDTTTTTTKNTTTTTNTNTKTIITTANTTTHNNNNNNNNNDDDDNNNNNKPAGNLSPNRIFSQDEGIKFGIEKCAILVIRCTKNTDIFGGKFSNYIFKTYIRNVEMTFLIFIFAFCQDEKFQISVFDVKKILCLL